MTNIKVKVTRTTVTVTIDGDLTSGMVGVPCTFEYGPEWEGLNKTAVFTAGCVTRDVLNAEGTVEVPPECLEYSGVRLYVGIYGTNADGTVVISTSMADVKRILPGTDPSGDESTRPELPVWAQLQADVNAMKESGGGNGKPGEDGGYYTPAVSQPDANHAEFTFAPSKEGMAEVPAQTVTLPAGPQGPQGEPGAAGPAGADGKDGVLTLTGARVGDIARVAAVDERGVPTAWEPVDMPAGGSSGEEWEELVNVTLEEEAVPILDIGDYAANFKKLRYLITVNSMAPTNVTFAMAIPNSTTGVAYNVTTIDSFGNASGEAIAFIEFEPLIENGFCKRATTWTTIPCVSIKSSSITYQYNSYDYKRLLTARYFRTAVALAAGTTIIIKGVRK